MTSDQFGSLNIKMAFTAFGQSFLLSYALAELWSAMLYCRIPVDRDYSKITEQHCSQVVTCYGENKFGHLNDVTVGRNNS